MIVEINGIKMEVDERTATIRKVDSFKVGDKVKVLVKTYSGYDSHFGVLVGFEHYKNRPSIVVAYLASSELRFAYLHKDNTEVEIIALETGDLGLEKQNILQKMDYEITQAEMKVLDLKMKRDYFLKRFGVYFEEEKVAQEA